MQRSRRWMFVAGCLTAWLSAAPARIYDHPAPGGQVVPSPDYRVTLRDGAQIETPFVHYSWNQAWDKWADYEGDYVKVPFFGLHSESQPEPENDSDTYAHSWLGFDFDRGPVEVEVKLLRQPVGITLPLQSAAVLPSVHGIAARVSGDTITFTMTAPAKIAIVPNAAEGLAELAGMEVKRAREGYRNPLFLFARAPEQNVPDKSAPDTLVVKPGELVTPEQVAACKLLWFEPGVHEYAKFNAEDPDHYLELTKGQMAYLAPGAYVYGHFRSNVFGPIADMPTVRGRGTLSGIKNRWSGIPWKHTPVKNIRTKGITITDRHNHLTGSPGPMYDVAAPGAWHGNTDGPAFHVPVDDPWGDWICDDCFVMGADTNLLIGGKAKVRNYTAWQLGNAEPLWINNALDGAVVDGLHVLCFNDWRNRQTINCVGINRGVKRNVTVRNVTIEAPYVPVLFRMTTDFRGEGQVFDQILFDHITVTTPFVKQKSPLGSAAQAAQFGHVTFRNLVIGGTKVTNANCRDWFDIADGLQPGREVVFE